MIFSVFFVFGYPGGGHGRVLSQLRGGFSAEAGTCDFERQYSVLGVFSKFGGLEKPRKSKKKLLGNLLFFGAAEKEVRDRFSRFLGSLLDSIFESRAEKKELDSVLFSETCFGSSPGEVRTHFVVVLGCLLVGFWRCLWPQSQRKR